MWGEWEEEGTSNQRRETGLLSSILIRKLEAHEKEGD